MSRDAAVGYAPISLPANSFNLQEMEAESKRIEKLPAAERQAHFDKFVETTALDQELLKAKAAPPVPEGTKLATVTDIHGREVVAPIAIPAEGKYAVDDERDGTEQPATVGTAGAPPSTTTGGGAVAGSTTTGSTTTGAASA